MEGQEPTPTDAGGQEPTPPGQEPTQQEPESKKTFDEDYVKELRKEAAEARTAKNKAEAKAQEYEDKDKSELEKATGERDKFKSEAETATAEALRLRVALTKQIPAELIDRLKGSTQEELEADADELLKLVKPATPGFDGGTRETAPESKTPEQAHNDLLLQLAGRQPQRTP